VEFKARPDPPKFTFVILTLLACVFAAAGLNAYLIRTDAAGDALWNSKEAYFFISRARFGWHVRWIGYPLMVAGKIFGYIEPPDDRSETMYVLRVTSSGVERHVLDLQDGQAGGPSMLTPIGDRIWTNFPALGGLCWWAGDHFERSTQEESRGLGGIEHLWHLNNRAYRDEGGWWNAGVAPDQTVVISLEDGTEISAYGGGRRVPLSIQMRKQGGEPSTVFSVDTGAGLVGGSNYQHAFRSPQ